MATTFNLTLNYTFLATKYKLENIHPGPTCRLGTHEASHRLGYQCSQGCHREHVLSFDQNDEDALYHSVKCVVQLLHVEGEGVVEQGDVELGDFCFTRAVALGVCVNRDLRANKVI